MITKQALFAGLILLAVYVAGAISGVALTRMTSTGRGPGFPAFPPGSAGFPRPGLSAGEGVPSDRGIFAGMLARRLDLSADQEGRVQEILEVHRQRLDSVLAGIRPNVEQQFSEMDTAIRAILTAEQARDYGAFVNEEFARLGGRNPLGPPYRPRPDFPGPP
ncbi:MAG TPA: hypothetical protein VLH75_13280 [Longimicrobiales bacterium]|nr:hypothetical protein [Longimicrobiales bacterium]